MIRIGAYTVHAHYHDPDEGHTYVLASDGTEWVSAIVHRSAAFPPDEWWQGDYFKEYGSVTNGALAHFLGRTSILKPLMAVIARAVEIVDGFAADSAPYISASGQVLNGDEYDHLADEYGARALALLRTLIAAVEHPPPHS